MKKVFFLVTVVIFISCKNTKKDTIEYSKETLNVTTSSYPENITKVFEAHGGLDKWNEMQSLVFTMQKQNGLEITTTDLKNRKSLIEMPNHTIGFNGEQVWLHSKDTIAYKGVPKFYYNLMFYFYAMPFILADDGIIYEDTKPLEFEGRSFPGIKISYEAGIGESPEDEYILYYNPDTYNMEWLGYTVTYFTKEKANELHFRKYSDWQNVNGLLLPKTSVRYNYKDNLPTTVHSITEFIDVKLFKEKPNPTLFEIPDKAVVVE